MTEEVLGIDLVQRQLAVAAGATLGSLGLAQAYVPKPRGYAMQLRVNMETMDETARRSRPAARWRVRAAVRPRRARRYVRLCRLPDQRRLRLAAGQGHRAFAGRNWRDVVQKAARALREFRIDGVATNIPFLAAVLAHPDFVANRITTGFIEAQSPSSSARPRRRPSRCSSNPDAADARRSPVAAAASADRPAGAVPVPAPLQGTVVAIEVTEGELVRPGQQIAVLESMKMEHLVTAPHGGRVTKSPAGAGVTLMQGEPILYLEPVEIDGHDVAEEEPTSISTTSVPISPN